MLSQQMNAAPLAHLLFSGDYTLGVTPVPIPNTAVKPQGPMIVPTSAKVGYCRNLSSKPRDDPSSRGFFCAHI